jgi:hypothetical protein
MGLSLGGSKNKSKSRETTDQTQTSTLSNRAAGMLTSGINDLQNRQYRQFDPSTIARFQNPYNDQVRDASLAQMGHADDVAFNNLKSNLAGSGGFGNERRGVMEGVLAGEQSRDRAEMIANLNAQGFQGAMGAALGENQNANQFDMQIQALINQLRGGFTNEGTQRLQGTTTGRTSGSGFNFGWASK